MLGDLRRLAAPLAANAAELPHLEGTRLKLEGVVTRAGEVLKEQAAFTAAKQEASKEIQGLVREGQRLANVLRLALKEHYGIRAEKLAEFGIWGVAAHAPRLSFARLGAVFSRFRSPV
jgi:hypothetical protein